MDNILGQFISTHSWVLMAASFVAFMFCVFGAESKFAKLFWGVVASIALVVCVKLI